MSAAGEPNRSGDARTALVLTGGGARAAYQVGVLSYLGSRLPDYRFPVITGVSAGAINAAFLASHRGDFRSAVADLRSNWCALNTEDVIRTDPWTLVGIVLRWAGTLLSGGVRFGSAARSLVDNTPLRRTLQGFVDPDRIEENIRSGSLAALAISTTSYQTGRTVTFVQGRPEMSTWSRVDRESRRDRITLQHVMASAAIPLVFPAEKVGSGWYGDGSIRQAAPLAPAVHLGADRVVAISSRYPRSMEEAARPAVHGYPPAAQVAGLLMNSVFLDALPADAARIERLNRLLSKIPPEERARERLREVEVLTIQPSLDLGRLSLRYEDHLPRGVRFLSRGLGTHESNSPDFLSYLLYESAYIGRMAALGERDAERQWPRIARFLGVPEDAGSERATAAV